MEMKKTILIYQEWENHFDLLSDEEKGQLIMALFAYNRGEDIPLNGMANMAFSFMKAQMDRDLEQYQKICERNRDNGKKGGRPKTTENPKKPSGFSENPNKPKKPDKDKDKDKEEDKDKDKDIDKKEKEKNIKKEKEKSTKTLCSSDDERCRGSLINYQSSENLTVKQPEDCESIDHSTTLKDKRFEQFWKAYPRKVGKIAAKKAFSKIKMDKALFDKIIDSIERFKSCDQWQKNNGQFIPNPSTWLNRGSWDDEIPLSFQNKPSNTRFENAEKRNFDWLEE